MGMPLDLAEAETDVSRKAAAYRMPSENGVSRATFWAT